MIMEVVYARTPLRKSLFLAGPTPRDADTPSWRPLALELLEILENVWIKQNEALI